MKGYDFLEKSPFYKFKNEEGTYHFFHQISDKPFPLEQGIIFTHPVSPSERPFFIYVHEKGINRTEIERTPHWFQRLFEETIKKYNERTRLRALTKGMN